MIGNVLVFLTHADGVNQNHMFVAEFIEFDFKISRIADTDAPDAPHHYCALIPIHSRAPLRPGDLRNDLAALPDILTVEEM